MRRPGRQSKEVADESAGNQPINRLDERQAGRIQPPTFSYNSGMSAPRFYFPGQLHPGTTVDLPDAVARHACRALRLSEGDALTLFDGRGGEYSACIVAAGRAGVTVRLLEWRDCERESVLPITLIEALQTGDKMDATVQKAVELGVARIVPVQSRRSVLRLAGERADRRAAHWRAVAVSACEQCGRNRLPVVEEVVDLARWLALPPASPVLRLVLSPEATDGLQMLAPLSPLSVGTRVELLIGAEGGLAPEEMALAAGAGFLPIRLGPRVLRTETAGMAAVTAIQTLWGDFS